MITALPVATSRPMMSSENFPTRNARLTLCSLPLIPCRQPAAAADGSKFPIPAARAPSPSLAKLLPDCAILLVPRDSDHENPSWSRDAFQVMNPAILIAKT
jgi:hypothetical protein